MADGPRPAARDFTVRIEAALDGDIGSIESVDGGGGRRQPPPPVRGITVSDAGILRGPENGDDSANRRTLEQLAAERAAVLLNDRYRFAREVAGHLQRETIALLERDHVVEAAVAHRSAPRETRPLTEDLWLPATYSRAAILRVMSPDQRLQYDTVVSTTDDKAAKNAILANACYKFVEAQVTAKYAGGLTGDNLKSYLSTIQAGIARILNSTALPNALGGGAVRELITFLQYRTMIQIGQTLVLPPGAYEDLAGSTDTLKPIIGDDPIPDARVLALLEEWDARYNNGAIKRKRDEVQLVNQSRLDEQPRTKEEGLVGYPKELAHLPETLRQVRFAPALSAKANETLDLVRRTLNITQDALGTADPVEFVSRMCSEGVKVLFTQIVAAKISMAEPQRRPESLRYKMSRDNRMYSEYTLRLSETLVRMPRAPPRYPYPFYRLRGENASGRFEVAERGGGGGGADEAGYDEWIEDAEGTPLGVPLVGAKRQHPRGRGKTGGELAAEALNARILRRYAGV